jgi:hypothetical protein
MFDDIKKEENQENGIINRDNKEPDTPGLSAPGPIGPEDNIEAKDFNQGRAEVEDILSEIDKDDKSPEKPAQFQPKQQEEDAAVLADHEAVETASPRSAMRKILILASIIIVLGLVSAAGFWGYKKFIKGAETEVKEEENLGQQPSDISAEADEAKEIEEEGSNDEVVAEQLPDSDQDGLTDEEERALGLNISSVDSDNDGLFDREEVKVYQTDPLNQDTDGDGYLDGEEVQTGYNPKGAGKLYELK